jgi:Acyl-CoA dehydrogenase, C-terminal domain
MRDLSAGPLLLGSSAMYVGLRLEVQPLHRQFVPRASSNVLASKPSAGRRDVPERRQLAHRCRVHGNRDRERRRWIIGCGCAWRQRTPAIRQGRSSTPPYHAAGATAIFESNPFERRFRDAHAVSQQVQSHFSVFEATGRYFLGLPPGTRCGEKSWPVISFA